ncbi:MAG: hypothetical protein D6690_10615 [Nitrospirae bacterium]|nr:MAG: hypothetical protein D6690_10615 [Nitrospirota bacterium]
MRTLKEERLWLRAFTNLEEDRKPICHWITVEDNQRSIHSRLRYKSKCSLEFEAALSEQGAAQSAAKTDSRSA